MYCDLHEDVLTADGLNPESPTKGQTSLDQLRKVGSGLILTTNYCLMPEDEEERLLDEEIVDLYKQRMTGVDNFVLRAKDVDNIEGLGLMLVQEGFITPEPANDNQAKCKMANLFDLGIRVLQPIYKGDEEQEGTSPIGTSAFDPLEVGEKKGLTDLGKRICKYWIKIGGIIDASHSSPATFRDIIAICKEMESPLLVSHTGLGYLGGYPRCLNGSQIKLLKSELEDIGYLVGVGLSSFFFKEMFGKEKLSNWWSALFCLAEQLGYDHIAIGSDLGGAISGLLGEYERADEILPDVFELLKEETNKGDRDKIIFENASKFFKENLPEI